MTLASCSLMLAPVLRVFHGLTLLLIHLSSRTIRLPKVCSQSLIEKGKDPPLLGPASSGKSTVTPIMANKSVPSTSLTTSYPSRPHDESTTSRPSTSMSEAATSRPRTGRPITAVSTISGDQQIICAVSESRGLSPVVGLAFVNLSTTEAVLCQISDNQTYVKTIHKLFCFEPSEILVMNTAADPKSKLYSFIEGNLPHTRISPIDRKYWAETTGMDYIQHLAFKQDLEAIKVAVDGNYYAICCFAAVGSDLAWYSDPD